MTTPVAPLTLYALYVYPIKSAGGIAVMTSEVGPRGLHLDRRWMVVNAAGRLVTQREFPRMALVRVHVEVSGLRLEAPQMPALTVPFEPLGASRHAEVWDDVMSGRSVSAQARSWWSDYLQGDFDLIYMPDEVERWQQGKPYRSMLSFADGNPFHLVTEASVSDLNARSPRQVTALTFRPNLVVGGALAPCEEDRWRRIRVGEVGFEVVESCARCGIVNVTADGRMGAEPLRTLTRTRLRDKKVPFGQHLIQDAPFAERIGRLRVGDVVTVLEVADTPNPMY